MQRSLSHFKFGCPICLEKYRRAKIRNSPIGGTPKELLEKTPPARVAGVGDEAFWMGSRVGGALYVLKREQLCENQHRPAADEASKIKRSKALAHKIVARL